MVTLPLWLVQVNSFYEHSSAKGEKVKGGSGEGVGGELKLKRKGRERGATLLAPPSLINFCLRPINGEQSE